MEKSMESECEGVDIPTAQGNRHSAAHPPGPKVCDGVAFLFLLHIPAAGRKVSVTVIRADHRDQLP